MTELKTIGDDLLPEDLLLVTHRHFSRSVMVLDGIIDQIRAGDLGRAKDVAEQLRQLSKALQAALEERARVEKLRRQETGAAAGQALDFAAARDEIGRRMACLRAAGNG